MQNLLKFGLLGIPSLMFGQNQQPNILLVISDDLRNELEVYGANHMKTPNLNVLSQDGITFSKAYVQQAVSSASRASFLTGCRPDVTGVDYPLSVYFVNTFLPQYGAIQNYLYANGYYTRTFGKIHHGLTETLSEGHYNPSNFLVDVSYALPENQNKPQITLPPFECADVPDEAYRDGLVSREVVETLKRIENIDAPFFMLVGFHKPHLPFSAPKKYWDLYDRDNLPLSPNPQATLDAPSYAPANHALKSFLGENDADGHILSESRQRELRHGYFACVSYVDAQYGKIVAELKRQYKYDNTIIIFISDHGWHLGDNCMWGKSTNFERAARAPMVIKPQVTKNKCNQGVVCERFVEYVDLYPTIAELAQLPVADYLEGTSMVPLLHAPTRPWKSAVFNQFPRKKVEGYSIRTSRWRYTEWRGTEGLIDAVELYDHANDPNETVNLAPTKKSQCTKMSLLLNAGWKGALPEGVVNNANNPLAPPSVPVGSSDDGEEDDVLFTLHAN